MTTEKRIKLAEAMDVMPESSKGDIPYDIIPEARELVLALIPDPYTSDGDCIALVRWLTERGFGVTVEIWPDGHSIALYSNANAGFADAKFFGSWKGDDYKQGVCELAIKVIDDET